MTVPKRLTEDQIDALENAFTGGYSDDDPIDELATRDLLRWRFIEKIKGVYRATHTGKSVAWRYCANCGNIDPNTLESNGLNMIDPEFTFFCTARVKPGECSHEVDPDQVGADGMVTCGMQWCPDAK